VIVFGDSFRNSGWPENITTAKNENIVGIKDGVAVLVKVYKLVARVLYEISSRSYYLTNTGLVC